MSLRRLARQEFGVSKEVVWYGHLDLDGSCIIGAGTFVAPYSTGHQATWLSLKDCRLLRIKFEANNFNTEPLQCIRNVCDNRFVVGKNNCPSAILRSAVDHELPDSGVDTRAVGAGFLSHKPLRVLP